MVQQLCSAGFTEEQSIDAVERCEILERAMDYLMSVRLGEEEEEEEGIFLTAPLSGQDLSSLWGKSFCGAEPLDPW